MRLKLKEKFPKEDNDSHTDETTQYRSRLLDAEGLLQKRDELTEFLKDHEIDIILVNETHLRPGNNPRIHNYRLYRKDRDGAGGGVGI